ncbi:RdgB/HAM1 family non-canonical purine NTP pyrophosphatase [Aureibacter tunicatorum]|uniref:dITP/XTP pyrophosphatase n=1 Tax=Aureibacter tunicatorum TaxID=866807 RepID=A0AAE3XHW1_9BACT|nr:RdgB/HAM1 family non-canonical purine NTP pyrophosphatase [Aureibacter tunicatorum]MDR6237996.1 XTP/dITP diphosphohydrolase [Aureibacter tunicatorum]BDD03029.1 non-canonical purine NTP pyrophosphatase [Aureibacter tunicatorum]
MTELCFATNNANKLREIQQMLGDEFILKGLKDIGCLEELAEDQDTLEGNSLQKAEFVAKKYGVACFADDTGLEVEALDNAPGVYSARYAGPQRDNQANISLVLENLKGKNSRKAQFRTVISLVEAGKVHQFTGIAKGVIADDLSGEEGFGYDPVFIPEGENRTFAQMSAQEKNAISHRGKAFRKLIEHLKNNHNRS